MKADRILNLLTHIIVWGLLYQLPPNFLWLKVKLVIIIFLPPVLLAVALLTLASLSLTSAGDCPAEPGCVYIIKEKEGSEYYKVGGTTRGADKRKREIQIGNPRRLEVAKEFPVENCQVAEIKAHDTARSLSYVANIEIDGRPTEWYAMEAA